MRLSVAFKVLLATATVMVAVPPSATVLVSGFQLATDAPAVVRTGGRASSDRRVPRAPVDALRMAKLGQYNLDVGDLFETESDATAKERKKRERAEKAKAKQEGKSKSKATKEESRKSTTTSSSNRRRAANNASSAGGLDLSNPISSLIAPLAPVAAIGAGRAYLTRREKLEEERRRIIEEEERKLAQRLAEIESKKAADGVSTRLLIDQALIRFDCIGC